MGLAFCFYVGVRVLYKVLYRKWRPLVFDDVIGQEQVTKTLKKELASGRVAHAYLFTGSKGTGKTTCAKILSKAVNCLNLKDSDPCCECENCKGIQNGSILDVVEIDAASNNGVDNIRDLREEAFFTPTVAKFRVYIIDEVHMLSIGAFNALLKILEEPPEHVIFILATTEVHKLPSTILSRCQRFEFRRIDAKLIAQRLEYIAKNEDIKLSHNAALLIARLSDGALRDALSLLDQCMSKANDIDVDLVCETAGNVRKEYLIDLASCIAQRNTPRAIELVNELYENSKSMSLLCEEMIHYFRNIMLIKTMQDPMDMVAYSEEEFKELKASADLFGLGTILFVTRKFQESLQLINKGVSPKVQMELTFIDLCEIPENSEDKSELLSRICMLEKQLQNFLNSNYVPDTQNVPKIAGQTSESKTSITAQTVNTAKDKASKVELASSENFSEQVVVARISKAPNIDNSDSENFSQWSEVLEKLSKIKRSLATSLKGSKASKQGNTIYISSAKSSAYILLKQQAMREALQQAAKEITGENYIFKKSEEKNDNIVDVATKVDGFDNFLDSIKDSNIDIKIN